MPYITFIKVDVYYLLVINKTRMLQDTCLPQLMIKQVLLLLSKEPAKT
jgi:hypothetical protein